MTPSVCALLLQLTLISRLTVDSMIITSVIAGPKKYNTVSFDLLPFPLAFSLPHKLQLAYRGHYTFRRPLFHVQSSMPVVLPMDFMPPPYAQSSPAAEDPYNAESTEEGEEQDPALESNSSPGDPAPVGEADVPSSGSEAAVALPLDPSVGASPSPRPYTGKAQVSSFIDNGQFVNANTKSLLQDAAFGDDQDNQSDERSGHLNPPPVAPSSEELKRRTILHKHHPGKMLSLGYEHKGEEVRSDPIAVHNRHPDSMPWGFSYEDMQKYYTTFQFTDAFRTPGTFLPVKDKKSLIASLLFG